MLVSYAEPKMSSQTWMFDNHRTHAGRMSEATNKHHVQIHFTQNGHWFTSARTPDGTVYVCDSLSASNQGALSESMTMQLAQLYGGDLYELVVNIPHAVQQKDFNDCGLFAMAFAHSFCCSVK